MSQLRFLLLAFLCVACATGDPPATEGEPPISAAQLLFGGTASLERGDFEGALGMLRRSADAASSEGDVEGLYAALFARARAESALGEYAAARATLLEALAQAEALGDEPASAAAVVALGGVNLALGEASSAEADLREGDALAGQAGLPALQAAALNDLGNLEWLGGSADPAADLYLRAADLAFAGGDPGLGALALANAARAQWADPDKALATVDRAVEALAQVPDSHTRAALLLNLGLGVHDAATKLPDRAAALRARAARLLESALVVAQARQDSRIEAHALGALGELKEEEGSPAEALSLTEQALVAGRFLDAPELTYRWEAQRGRLLAASGRQTDAIAAFERAVATLQLLRSRQGWRAELADSSFEVSVAPIYRELLDELLKAAADQVDPAARQGLLVKARAVMESFKAAELRDYFRDDCVDAQRARTRELETVSSEATIIYPILLPERTALLLSSADGKLDLVSVPVSRAEVEAEARAFRVQLERQATRRYLVHARRLYDWLIRPLGPRLEVAQSDTLVFVPDGALMLIPMAALHDGEQFLVERFALATTPGFDLVDPAPMNREAMESLLAGISKSVAGQPALPNVAAELEAVDALLGGQVMLDEAFLRADLRESLEDRSFGIVHIATHAQFSARPEDTYLLAWDGRLGLDELSEDVGLFRFRDEPLELLTLSACETARGDDRAGLGLSGMAVKAGARSVLGSLWSVNDPAATALVEVFYARLMAGDSRAQALRAAQLELLADFRYRHPAYWAPYLLIGTWL